MALSTDSLIHFTKSKTAFKGILENGFRVKYCLEHIINTGGKVHGAFPMVSFCNIPLSEIKNHIKNYGHYGIGLNMDWGTSKGLNPVLYMEKKSTIANRFSTTLFRHILKGKSLDHLTEIEESLVDIVRYMKNYEDDLVRKGKTIKNYRFFDEHEWRYVPSLEELDGAPTILHIDHYKELKEQTNKMVSGLYLTFEPKDIKYLIIKNESEIPSTLNFLDKIFALKYEPGTIKKLLTRIITVDQIFKDF